MQSSFNCSVCQSTFTSKLALTGHMRSHPKPSIAQCNICKRTFTLESQVKGHISMEMHTDITYMSAAVEVKQPEYPKQPE